MKNYRLIQKRIELKRFLSRLRSKYIKKLRNGGKVNKIMSQKLHLKKKTSFYNRMGASRKRDVYTIKVLKIFDLSTDPETVINFLDTLKKDLYQRLAFDLYIDHRETEIINLDASYLFDKIIKDYSKYWSKLHIKIKISGRVSKNIEVNNFLLSFGLLHELDITRNQLSSDLVDNDYSNKYITFKKYGNSNKSYLAGNTSTELVNYFNNCFIENNFQIKDDAKSNLVDCFGEIIKNAE